MDWLTHGGLLTLAAILGGLIVKVGPVILSFLTGKAQRDLAERDQIEKERAEFYHLRVQRISDLVSQVNKLQKDVAECVADRAALRQELNDLKGR